MADRSQIIGATIGACAVIAAAVIGVASHKPSADQAQQTAPPVESAPPRPVQKSFQESVELSERGATVVHGVTIRVGSIGVSTGYFADVFADNAGGRVSIGDTIQAYREGCADFKVVVADISLSKPPGVSDDDLRQMGMAAEALVTRKAKLVVAGRCAD